MFWFLLFGSFHLINLSIQCSTPPLNNLAVVSNFSLKDFFGRWFEIKWYTTEIHNESTIWRDYIQSFQYETNSTQRLTVNGRARTLDNKTCFSFGPWSIIANNSAKMILEKRSPESNTSLNWPYYILQTDYLSYALIYACRISNITANEICNEPSVWMFSRTTSLSKDDLVKLDDYINNTLCMNLSYFEKTPHSDTTCDQSSSIILKFDFKLQNYSLLLYCICIFYIFFHGK